MTIQINISDKATKWLAVLLISIVFSIGITSAGIVIGDPDSNFNFLHGNGGNITGVPAAQIAGNFTQNINFSSTITASGLSATVPSDAAICRAPTTKEITVNTGITDCSVSSEVFKENIVTLDASNTPDNFDKIRSVKFNNKNDPEKKEKIGLIAQEVKQLYPEAIGYGDNGEIRGINYNMLIPVIISKVQEQQNININQQNEINLLRYQQLCQMVHLYPVRLMTLFTISAMC